MRDANEINKTFFLRIVALLVDIAACTLAVVICGIPATKGPSADGGVELHAWALLIPLVPFLLMVIPTALWGYSIGKFICRIRVCKVDQTTPGFARSFLRELTKLTTFVLFGPIGPFVAFIQAGMGKSIYYDGLCGTDVEFIGGLTKTQRNFRRSFGKY
jgi:uncharacterized RDD family membrane protein YckC